MRFIILIVLVLTGYFLFFWGITGNIWVEPHSDIAVIAGAIVIWFSGVIDEWLSRHGKSN